VQQLKPARLPFCECVSHQPTTGIIHPRERCNVMYCVQLNFMCISANADDRC